MIVITESSRQEREPEYPEHDNEIDLADLAWVIYRRRWIIVGVTILVTLGAIAYTFTLPRVHQYQATLQIGKLPKYEYPVGLELGGLQVADRSRHFIESQENVAFRIKQLGREEDPTEDRESMAEEGGRAIDPSILEKVTVTADEETGIVELELRSSTTDASGRVLNTILDRIVQEHERLLEDEQQFWWSAIEIAEAELRWLENEPDNLRQEFELLDERRREIEEYLQRTNERRDQLHEAQQAARTDNPREPVAALLLTNELENLERRARNLHRELSFDIPERRRVLRNEAHNLELRVVTVRQQLAAARHALDESTPTRVLEFPATTGKLVSPNYQFNIALGVILGGFLSVFLVFLIEFWSKNKYKIVNG